MTALLDESWRKAACRAPGIDPDIFFGDATPLARVLCGRCPIAEACREFVTEHPQEFGVWAGLTPDERRNGKPPGARYCRTCSARFNVSVHDPFRQKCPSCLKADDAKRVAAQAVRGGYYCVNQHPLDAVNTRIDSKGKRVCRRCNTEKIAERRSAQKVGAS